MLVRVRTHRPARNQMELSASPRTASRSPCRLHVPTPPEAAATSTAPPMAVLTHTSSLAVDPLAEVAAGEGRDHGRLQRVDDADVHERRLVDRHEVHERADPEQRAHAEQPDLHAAAERRPHAPVPAATAAAGRRRPSSPAPGSRTASATS